MPTALDLSHAAGIFGSPSGDVWVASPGKLARYSAELPPPGAGAGAVAGAPPSPGGAIAAVATSWQIHVAPVFARVCAHCHLPDGSSGVDLSTPAAWGDERAEIRKRVIATKTMPPAGTAMADADRAAIASWLDAK